MGDAIMAVSYNKLWKLLVDKKMSKSEEFKRLMEISSSNRVVLLTNHYQIVGQVYDCEECNREAYINLTNASLCLINDVYENQTCDQYTSSHYDWLHVNFDKVVAFTFKG